MIMCIYNYQMELSYIAADNREYRIAPQSVVYMMIDYDYINAIIPTLCMRIKLDSSVYDRMVRDQGRGKVELNIMKYNISGTSNIKKSYIHDQFDYIMTNKPNPAAEMDKLVEGKGIAYRECTIGLVKKELTQLLQKSFNGIMKNTNMSSLVMNALAGMKVVMEPLKYNTDIETTVIPPVNNIPDYLSYLNGKYNFYGDQYLFFADMDKVYLKSSSGKYIDARDGQYPYVAIDIRDLSNYQSYTTGMVIDSSQDAYIIYVDKTDVEYQIDRITPQVSANIMAIDNEGIITGMESIDTSKIVNTVPNQNSGIVVRNDTDANIATYVANTLKNNTATITITKTEMDTSIFTPNKEYLISNYEGIPAFTGRYVLASKKEVLYNRGNYFASGVTLGLKLVVHY